ncbi:Atg7p [Sporobolomyces salmoneus]|uniref:Atg7p n=1 Tax=Sporobolomyces salmoneus TaxID=183962 RepID=UPI00317BF75C
MTSNQSLQFLPLSTSISPSFWHALTSVKLHQLKLSQDPVPIHGYYSKSKQVKDRMKGNELVGISSGLELDHDSFSSVANSEVGSDTNHGSPERIRLNGILRNFNTIEEFKQCDKAKLAQEAGEQIWSQIEAGSSEASLESLNPFLIVTFADLKKYKYYYWACFPALVQKPGWELAPQSNWEPVEIPRDLSSHTEATLARPSTSNPDEMEYAPISDFASFWANTDAASRTVIYSDPSSHPSAPGWTLRNLLSYLTLSPSSSSLSLDSVRLLLIRETSALSTTIRLKSSTSDASTAGEGESRKMPSVAGWEKNAQGSLGPRMADLGPLMDPIRLADQAVDLNLQLMRWRILPELNLEKVKETKCLILGAGTLGCYVSRTLMAWGVRKITLLDSSTVSFSNPVRQPLFEFEDSLHGGKPKAQAAAESLKRIYPGVDATGVSLSIPMPGHPIPPNSLDRVRREYDKLEQLIDSHDVVFLGMDSRESRWLPTVMGAAKGKLVMNVALGFDTFLVMRHGVPSPTSTPQVSQTTVGTPFKGKLGCYYCNDIVAPMDSLSGRTLDQMCTVTRPGLAAIASATAVELMVSILQHPLGALAPSDVPLPASAGGGSAVTSPDGMEEPKSVLGEVPHQIRGFLAQFNNLKITGQAYDRCTGCSVTMIESFKKDGFELVRQACEDAKYLERITGLDKLEEETEKMLADGADWEEDDDGDDF